MNTIVAHEADPFERAAPAVRQASQATMIEQSRAVAEVQAAVVLAAQRPRDIQRAVAEMRQSCQMFRLAERAFFRYSRGDQQVTGASIHLARELARCWGNIDYGIKELRRDVSDGVSEMLAFAWDMETNTRLETAFIVPHVRDTRRGRKELTDQRDIYENNANNAARRVRECIFGVLPPWLTEEAKDLCHKTIEKGVSGNGKTLQQSIADCVTAFEALRITRKQMEDKIGRPAAEWIDQDVAALRVIFGSLKRGEMTVEEEFGSPDIPKPPPADADDFERAAAGQAPEPPPAALGEIEPQTSQEPQKSGPNDPGETLPVEPAADPLDIPPELDRRDNRSPEEWMKAAHKLIDDIQACSSLKAYEVLTRSQRFVNTLAAMKEAGADQQIDAVVEYQEVKRRELEQADA